MYLNYETAASLSFLPLEVPYQPINICAEPHWLRAWTNNKAMSRFSLPALLKVPRDAQHQ